MADGTRGSFPLLFSLLFFERAAELLRAPNTGVWTVEIPSRVGGERPVS
jgi:hypothetical protein